MLSAVDDQGTSARTLSPLRATGIVALGSAVTLALSVVTAKVYALLIGPEGIGLLALMQAIMIVGVMVASAGLATSAVRAIAGARLPQDVAVIAGSAMAVGLAGGVAFASILILLREPLATVVLGDADRVPMAVIVSLALAIAVVASVQIAILTGLHRVRDVVVVNVGTAAVAAVVGIVLVARFGIDGLAPAILLTAVAQIGLSWVLSARANRSHAPRRPHASTHRVRRLVAGGIPVAAGQLAGSGAMFLVPIVVLQLLDTADVGFYRAAAAISIGYLTFFLAALTQDFYPRLSRAANEADLAQLVLRRMRLLMGLGLPLILGLLASGPVVIELLYSAEFGPSYSVLEWHLIGDLFRLPAWVLVFVLLARGGAWIYTVAEGVGGLGLISVTWLGVAAFGLVGTGIGYALVQIVYYGVALVLSRRYVATTPGRLQLVVIATALGASMLILAPVDQVTRSVLFGAAAVVAAAAAWPRLYRLHRAGEL